MQFYKKPLFHFMSLFKIIAKGKAKELYYNVNEIRKAVLCNVGFFQHKDRNVIYRDVFSRRNTLEKMNN